ncbi:MAG: trypsin-like peptidase domain-containing protein [Firmicutes bacterium]|nr:trypsin-like peptidase domain-containing protein [Bacillota bacterium]
MDNFNYASGQSQYGGAYHQGVSGARMSGKAIVWTIIASVVIGCLVVVATIGWLQDRTGLSAFELAVRNGFQGTEQEWLAGLQGSPGQDGRDTDAFMDMVYQEWQQAVTDGLFTGTLLEFLTYYFSGPQGDNMDLTFSARTAMRSSVAILASFQNAIGESSASTGSGVIYYLGMNGAARNGYAFIITNYHVIGRHDVARVVLGVQVRELIVAHTVQVFLYGMPTVSIPASIVGGSAQHDIAILKVKDNETIRNTPVRAVTLPTCWNLTAGEPIIAVGNPLNDGISVTDGVVSRRTENIQMQSIENPSTSISYRVFRISAAINPGNSGGGIFNARGEMVGIAQARLFSTAEGRPVDNIGYAIPLDIAIRIADQIIDRAELEWTGNNIIDMRRPTLGITVTSVNITWCDDADDVEVIETIKISGFNNPQFNVQNHFQINDVFVSMTYQVRGQWVSHDITRMFHIGDFLIDLYGVGNVTFSILRGGVPMDIIILVG